MTDPLDPHQEPVLPVEEAAVPGIAPGPAPAPVPATPVVAASEPLAAPEEAGSRPTFVFFGVLAAISLVADVSTKAWAEITLSRRNPLEPSIELIKDHLAFTLAYNPGGAWGLFQRHSEYVRRPFFLLVSLLAIAFIINLYGRLTPGQRALKWGLPLVLGGALGNLSDRIVRSNVIDFIDYQAKWIEAMNRLIAKLVSGWSITDHWPTFNVADIAICVGVGLMAVDMFTSRRGPSPSLPPKPPSVNQPPVGVLPVPTPLSEPTPPLKPEA
jgi:signal peptidase II